jgi:methylthioribose-1-phosphate isomerase
MLQTIAWTGAAVRLLDQTKLPDVAYVEITDERQMHDAIRRLVVRGAPAIGVAAAFGAYLGVKDFETDELVAFDRRLDEVCAYLATSRPTAVNLFWALDRIRRVADETRRQGSRSQEQMVVKTRQRILAECLTMFEEDAAACRAIGEHGLRLLEEVRAAKSRAAGAPLNVLTHCNAGACVAVRWGTALAPIYVGHERGAAFHVYADETRPLLQGSRITATELRQAGVPVTVLCDNMTASAMAVGKVDACIVGADRIAANGDTANKIGTLGVAILARHFGVPFFVAAPLSTIDVKAKTGADIPIEQRSADEVTHVAGRATAPDGVDAYNPAFDVTPAELIAAIVTEKGVLRPPYGGAIARLF